MEPTRLGADGTRPIAQRGWETSSRQTRHIRRFPTVLVTALCAALAGCNALDDLVGVEAPSRIGAEEFETPENAGRLLAGVVGDFWCAFSHYVVFQGTMAEELQWSGGNAAWQGIDARTLATSGLLAAQALSTCSSEQIPGLYLTLSIARAEADHLVELLEGWTDAEVPNRSVLRATALVYAGYSFLLLGESMCSAAFDQGPEAPPPEIFALAESRFTSAIESGSLDSELLNLARIGRARTLQNLGDLGAAKAEAASVPEGFRFDAEFSTVSPRRENFVYGRTIRDEHVTVETPFRALDDPRVQVEDQGRVGTRGGVTIWHQLKYTSPTSPMPIATWEEAQLIVAEAELQAGNLQAAADAINRVRTRPEVGLPPFSSSDADEIREQVLFERKVELFLEGHRLGDIRRYELPLVPPAGDPYPVGGFYGDQRCVPLPDVERNNNPNI